MSATRKPRIALMGEFSAGKSTLSNLLLGARPLPEKVTATRLSPVWMSYGTDVPYRVDVDGTTEPVSLDQLETIPVDETRVIRLFMEADILEVCDLIDFPGISDPNMSSSVWERVLTEVDAVIWCTHATQAWRQSEAAVWETIPDMVRENSILLITRYDKLTSENDRRRVFKRVLRETDGMFGGTFPISLIQALQAGDDYDKWDASGAGAFVNHLIDMIQKVTDLSARTPEPLYNFANGTSLPAPAAASVTPRRVARPLDTDRTARQRPAPDGDPGTAPVIRTS
ncbi:dynamin family protein [Yoonia sp.]|uniref:dynamin family protein n=1 Tax=Yoonia sp. TaxID=2212373 RepID=UPI003F6C4783